MVGNLDPAVSYWTPAGCRCTPRLICVDQNSAQTHLDLEQLEPTGGRSGRRPCRPWGGLEQGRSSSDAASVPVIPTPDLPSRITPAGRGAAHAREIRPCFQSHRRVTRSQGFLSPRLRSAARVTSGRFDRLRQRRERAPGAGLPFALPSTPAHPAARDLEARRRNRSGNLLITKSLQGVRLGVERA